MIQGFSDPISFLFSLLSIVIAITIHEFSHALIADRLGDPTPRLQERLTLNPKAHIDPIGIILIILIGFGWGKPVQFDAFNLRNPRRDGALISIAGPVSNILLAILCSLGLRLLLTIGSGAVGISLLEAFLVSLLRINVVLCIFNFLPIHPLDGFKIVAGLLPSDKVQQWYELERYGFLFLIFLLLPIGGRISPVQSLIGPPINFLLHLLIPQAPLI